MSACAAAAGGEARGRGRGRRERQRGPDGPVAVGPGSAGGGDGRRQAEQGPLRGAPSALLGGVQEGVGVGGGVLLRLGDGGDDGGLVGPRDKLLDGRGLGGEGRGVLVRGTELEVLEGAGEPGRFFGGSR